MKIKTYYSRIVEDQEFEKHLISEKLYNEANERIEHVDFDEKGNIIFQELRNYTNGLLISSKTFDSQAKTLIEKIYSYQENVLVEEKEIFENGTFMIITHSYNKMGELTKSFVTDESKVYLGEEIIRIDGAKKEIEYYDDQHFIFRKETLLHNSRGDIIEKNTIEYFDGEKNVDEEYVFKEYFEYDSRNNLISKITYRGETKLIEISYSYDYKNRVEEENNWNIEFSNEITVKYRYDSRGNLENESVYENNILVEESMNVFNLKNELIRTDMMSLEVDDYKFMSRYSYEYT